MESEIDEVYRYPEGDDFCKIMHANTKEVHDESDKIVKSRLAIVLTDKVIGRLNHVKEYLIILYNLIINDIMLIDII